MEKIVVKLADPNSSLVNEELGLNLKGIAEIEVDLHPKIQDAINKGILRRCAFLIPVHKVQESDVKAPVNADLHKEEASTPEAEDKIEPKVESKDEPKDEPSKGKK